MVQQSHLTAVASKPRPMPIGPQRKRGLRGARPPSCRHPRERVGEHPQGGTHRKASRGHLDRLDTHALERAGSLQLAEEHHALPQARLGGAATGWAASDRDAVHVPPNQPAACTISRSAATSNESCPASCNELPTVAAIQPPGLACAWQPRSVRAMFWSLRLLRASVDTSRRTGPARFDSRPQPEPQARPGLLELHPCNTARHFGLARIIEWTEEQRRRKRAWSEPRDSSLYPWFQIVGASGTRPLLLSRRRRAPSRSKARCLERP